RSPDGFGTPVRSDVGGFRSICSLHSDVIEGSADGRDGGGTFLEQHGVDGAGIGDGRGKRHQRKLYGDSGDGGEQSGGDVDGIGQWRIGDGRGDGDGTSANYERCNGGLWFQ